MAIKRYLLEYNVRDKSGNSTPHKERFDTPEELEAWLITTRVGIEANGGSIDNVSIVDLALQ